MTNEKKQHTPASSPGKGKMWIFAGILALTVLPDFFLKKKGYFHAVEGVPGFFGLLGLASCLVVFLLAKGLAPLLKRREDYYE